MPLLEIQDLQKRLGNASDGFTLSIGSFTLGASEQLAVIGQSGSGKTTFLNIIAGLVAADSGAVRLDGVDLASLSEPERDRFRAERIGYVFQSFNLLAGYSALENVLLGMSFSGRADRARATALLKRVGLAGLEHRRPPQLSIGQQQRVALARALASQPKLVLADEPTANLDEKNATAALALIREICRENQSALLLVSHDPQLLKQFDRVVDFRSLNATSLAPAPAS